MQAINFNAQLAYTECSGILIYNANSYYSVQVYILSKTDKHVVDVYP